MSKLTTNSYSLDAPARQALARAKARLKKQHGKKVSNSAVVRMALMKFGEEGA